MWGRVFIVADIFTMVPFCIFANINQTFVYISLIMQQW